MKATHLPTLALLLGALVGCSCDPLPPPRGCLTDEDRAPEGAVRSAPCTDDAARVRDEICRDGQWEAIGECHLPHECAPGDEDTLTCGINRRGRALRVCEDGAWSGSQFCDEVDVCEDGAVENTLGNATCTPCGINGRGVRTQSCITGQWDCGPCQEPDECVDGEHETLPCGEGSPIEQLRVCAHGHWTTWSACPPPGECIDGDVRAASCGHNGRGRRRVVCQDGVWLAGGCDDGDTCVDDALDRRRCGLNGNGVQDRRCADGQWPAWDDAACDDPDACVYGEVQQFECGGGRLRVRRCLVGQWSQWGPCFAPDPCVGDSDCEAGDWCAPIGVCLAPSCQDGIRNGTEEGIDCGEPCQPCPADEVCNGLDDDRDGVADEDLRLGEGCQPLDAPENCEGTRVCGEDGAVVCLPPPGVRARFDDCDGIDDDCDGTVDENGAGACVEALPGTLEAMCVDGRCRATECLPGDIDADGDRENSCEVSACIAETVGADVERLGRACTRPVGDGGARCLGTWGCDLDRMGEPTVVCRVAGAPAGEPIACGACADEDFLPAVEACDGADDDCDGTIDEGFADLGAACGLAGPVGPDCSAGVVVCRSDGAGTICDTPPPPAGAVETCNALDDDCDGATDEACPGGPNVEVGYCLEDATCAVDRCAPGWADLDGDPDNGCEAPIDCPEVSEPCFAPRDADAPLERCGRLGRIRCVLDDGVVSSVCVPDDANAALVGGRAEVCNDWDDDCDGITDEEVPSDGPCTDGIGACQRGGQLVCVDGAFACDAVPGEPADEVCNDIDDDCNGTVDGFAGSGTGDLDDDGVADLCDNCPEIANAGQRDTDGDGAGDLCDVDLDDDGVPNDNDVCPQVRDPLQLDADGDTVGDACDLCPSAPDPEQWDSDLDGIGDACDICPLVEDAEQLDEDDDGVGDACRPTICAGDELGPPCNGCPAGTEVAHGWVCIPAGEFVMGSPLDDGWREGDEVQTPVRISTPFLMQATEVTQSAWRRYFRQNPSSAQPCAVDAPDGIAPGLLGGTCPLETVTWFEAAIHANALTDAANAADPALGLTRCYTLERCNDVEPGERLICGDIQSDADCTGYRLPTEAEWEYAVRAGTSTRFWSGDDPSDLERVDWCVRNADEQPHRVGQLAPNPWGLHDTHGNVNEWCHDEYAPYPVVPDGGGPIVDPVGVAEPSDGDRIIRGAGYRHQLSRARSAARGAWGAGGTGRALGYRLVRRIAAPDRDGDGIADSSDGCPGNPDPEQWDSDLDGIGDACDRCPLTPDPGQRDTDGDGVGDACEPLVCAGDEVGPPCNGCSAGTLVPPGWVCIPAGTFWMGSPADEPNRDADEGPRHRVTLTRPYLMMETEATVALWQWRTGRPFDLDLQCDDDDPLSCPLRRVSWIEALVLANDWSMSEGLSPCYRTRGEAELVCEGDFGGGCDEPVDRCRGAFGCGLVEYDPSCTGYRLPTEAEWAHAARAGTETAYWFGDDPQGLTEVGWYEANSGNVPSPVGRLLANPWGLYDVHGNLFEWVYDFYGRFSGEDATDPYVEVDAGFGHVPRGGSFLLPAHRARSATRDRQGWFNYRTSYCGFRLARAAQSLCDDSHVEESAFDADDHEWTGAQVDELSAVEEFEPVELAWSPDGGADGGHVSLVDPSAVGGVYFSAPPAALGDRRFLIDGELQFSRRSDQPGDGRPLRVVVIGDGRLLSHQGPPSPADVDVWTPMTVRLVADEFVRLDDAGEVHPVEPEVFEAVFGAVEAVLISAESQGAAGETVALDSVRWVHPVCLEEP